MLGVWRVRRGCVVGAWQVRGVVQREKDSVTSLWTFDNHRGVAVDLKPNCPQVLPELDKLLFATSGS